MWTRSYSDTSGEFGSNGLKENLTTGTRFPGPSLVFLSSLRLLRLQVSFGSCNSNLKPISPNGMIKDKDTLSACDILEDLLDFRIIVLLDTINATELVFSARPVHELEAALV